MGSILNLLGLLGLLMYVFAIMGYYFYGPDINLDVSTLSDAEARFSSLGSAFIVLWSYVTADGWAFFQYELDARGFTNSRFYSVFFVFIGAFIFTNLFIGIILQNLDEATSEDLTLQDAKRMLLSRLKKKMLQQRQQHDLRRLMAIQQSHPEVSMPQILATLAGKLSDDEQVPLTHTLFDLTWLECFSTTLRLQEQTLYRQQQLHFEVAATLSELWESKQECVHDPWTALPNAAEFDMFLDDDISENVAQTRQNDQDFELYNGNTDNDAEEQGHVFDFRIHSRSVSKAPPRDVLSPSHSTQLGWQYDSTRYQTDQHAPSDIAYRSAASAPRHHARVDSSAGAFLDLIQQPLPAIEAFPALPIASSSTAHRTQRVLRSICASAIDQPTLPDQMASINENDDVFFSEETPKQEGSKKEI